MDFVISNKSNKEYFKFWQNALDNYESKRKTFYINQHAKMISRYIKSGKILDIGIGTGILAAKYMKMIKKKKIKIQLTGLDYSVKRLEIARKKYGIKKLIQGNAEKLPFKNNTFDQIICYATLPYIQNKKAFFKECKRVLKRDGELLLNFSNQLYYDLSSRLGPILNLTPKDVLKRLFYLNEVIPYFKKAGFTSISWEGYNVCPLNMLNFLDNTFLKRIGWEFLVIGKKQ